MSTIVKWHSPCKQRTLSQKNEQKITADNTTQIATMEVLVPNLHIVSYANLALKLTHLVQAKREKGINIFVSPMKDVLLGVKV